MCLGALLCLHLLVSLIFQMSVVTPATISVSIVAPVFTSTLLCGVLLRPSLPFSRRLCRLLISLYADVYL